MSKNKYLIITDFFNRELSLVKSSLTVDRLRLCLLVAFLNVEGNPIRDESGFLRKEDSFLPQSQELNISLTDKGAPVFCIRKNKKTFYIEQNLAYYQLEFGKPFTVTILDDGKQIEKVDAYFDDIESYLLRKVNSLEIRL